MWDVEVEPPAGKVFSLTRAARVEAHRACGWGETSGGLVQRSGSNSSNTNTRISVTRCNLRSLEINAWQLAFRAVAIWRASVRVMSIIRSQLGGLPGRHFVEGDKHGILTVYYQIEKVLL